MATVQVFPVIPEDYPRLSAFLSESDEQPRGEIFWRSRLHHWWDRNPAFQNQSQRGWTLQEERNIVGFIGMIPSFFQVAGIETTVFSVTTWRVLPVYRKHSMKLLFELLRAAGRSLLFDTTPDAKIAEVLKVAGFESIPGSGNGKSLILINARKLLARKVGHHFGGGFIGPLLEVFLRTTQSYRTRGLGVPGPHEVRRLGQADRSFDELWKNTRHLYRNTNLRTAEVINWYCFGNTAYPKELFACYKAGRLSGYAVCRGKENGECRELECVDLWLDPRETGGARSVVYAVREFARKNFYDLISFSHFTNELGQLFKQSGLWSVGARQSGRYFKVPPELRGRITGTNSYFVGHQGDYGL
ncbi:MAG: hypothetical protein HYU34_02865 [Candidatus Omnitrophica bacterium]|nr:hypothetical protein [Candidatus Omnitrophota bacterium]